MRIRFLVVKSTFENVERDHYRFNIDSPGVAEMPDLVNELTAQTGLSPELVQKGLRALLSFLETQLGQENFNELRTSLPEASALMSNAPSSPPPPESSQGKGGLFDAVSGLAGKFLGGKSGGIVDLLATFSKLGFKPEQIQPFLITAFELIQPHLSPELLQKLMAALPILAKMMSAGAK